MSLYRDGLLKTLVRHVLPLPLRRAVYPVRLFLWQQLCDLKRRLMRRSEGEDFLLQKYVRVHGKHLNLTNPQNFTEKLFCRMIS